MFATDQFPSWTTSPGEYEPAWAGGAKLTAMSGRPSGSTMPKVLKTLSSPPPIPSIASASEAAALAGSREASGPWLS